jgi:hypothetical protein
MTVDAAILGCCCGSQPILTCSDLWQCSTLQKFKLNYDVGITFRRTGTSAAGPQVLLETIVTMSGSTTYQKAGSALTTTMYTHAGPSNFTWYSRSRFREFYTGVNCQPCGSTYLYQDNVYNASGSTTTPATAWAWMIGKCNTCGCGGGFNAPRYVAFAVGGFGSYTRSFTTYNQSGVPSTTTGSGSCYAATTVCPPDGCIRSQWFSDCAWNTCDAGTGTSGPIVGRLTTSTGSTLASFPDGYENAPCLDLVPPSRCSPDPCNPVISANFNASGCANLFGDYHVCQTGAGFVCGCDSVETNGCVPTIDTYDKFGTFSIQVV